MTLRPPLVGITETVSATPGYQRDTDRSIVPALGSTPIMRD